MGSGLRVATVHGRTLGVLATVFEVAVPARIVNDVSPQLIESRPQDGGQLVEESLGDRFAAGVVFRSGPRRTPYTYSDSMVGLPIYTLWGTGA